MTALATHFTEQELQPIRNGMRTFIRLTGLISHEFQYRWFADEFDGVSSIKAIGRAVQMSARMLGKTKYQGQAFDAVRQIREDLAGSMLTGETETVTIANRKRYSPLFYLVIEPIVNLLGKFDHQTLLNVYPEIIDEFAAMLEATDCYGDFDDALIAQEMTRRLIRDREETIKASKQLRKRRKKAEKIELEIVEDEPEEVEETEEA